MSGTGIASTLVAFKAHMMSIERYFQVNVDSNRLLRRVGIAIVAAATLTAAGCSLTEKASNAVEDAGKSDAARSKVGDCINVIEGSMIDSELERIDCASDKAVYRVVQVFGQKTECDPDYTSYEETLGNATRAFLCLAPNFKEGACYHEDSMTGFQYAPCGTSDASFRVTQRIDGVADETRCAEDTYQIITLADPPTTFCLDRPST